MRKQQSPAKENPPPDEVVVVMDHPSAGNTTKSGRSPDLQTPSSSPNPTTKQQPPSQLPPRPALTRLPHSKPKSRFIELNHPKPTPQPEASHSSDDEDELEGADPDAVPEKYLLRRKKKIGWRALIEWTALVLVTGFLVCSLTLPMLEHRSVWGLDLWKWSVMALVVFSGRLVSGWLVWILVFLIERQFLLREKVLYFVYGLRRSVQNCVWLGLLLLSWTLLFDPTVQTSSGNRRLLARVSRVLTAVLVGAAIWLVKIFLVKMLASSFHVATFFDRMKESVFHHYILEALSGTPVDQESGDESGLTPRVKRAKSMPARLGSRKIDIERLRRLSRAGKSACSVKRLVGFVMSRGLSTVSNTVDRTMEEFGRAGSEDIASELEARISAERVFKNVAKPCQKYIEEEDLARFLTKEEVHTIFPLFEGALETGRIKKSAFRNWVLRAYLERKSLAHSLNDTKTAVQQLHKLASAVVTVIIVVVSLLVMGVATTKVFVVVTSQLLVLGFMFQNTGKTIFESIIFVFVMHPFDVGDRCVIDGVQMIVEEMNILSTVFLRHDNEKIFYPNSVLLTKPISNFYRSPDMGDLIEFSIDVSTSLDTIVAMKKCIQSYIESKPKHWNQKHSVVVKEIENVNRMKMALNVLHTMNHQNFAEKNNRRSELLLELKRIFESLGIKYHLLPQEVHLTQVVMANGRIPTPVQTVS